MYIHCEHHTVGTCFSAGIHHWGFPSDKAGLLKLGGLANATGAACVEVLGALPDAEESARRVASLFPEASSIVPGMLLYIFQSMFSLWSVYVQCEVFAILTPSVVQCTSATAEWHNE